MIRTVEPLARQPFDLLVVGGGITGAGVALDAVLRGLRVALIDKGDFASGTGSVSSKLVHGGLRYLEHGDFRLVYEALHERRRLLRNAPHIVRPLRFILPFYRGARMPRWQGRLGLTLYDLLAGGGNLRRSRPLALPRLLKQMPQLRPNNLLAAAEYYDAQMDDARLCLEVARTAALLGACVVNYVEAVALERTGGRVSGVTATDRIGGQSFVIQARQVLNATGPWSDRLEGEAGGEPQLRPTKGAHIVVPDLGLPAALLLLHPADGRVFFVIPWLGKTLIGTTDTLSADSPDALTVTPAEVAYLLTGFNHYLQPPLLEADVRGRFAGLRPLIRSRPDQPASMTREFKLVETPSGLLSVVGGKYTTYRHMAEIATDAAARRLRCPVKSRTHDFLLDGTPPGPWLPFRSRAIIALEETYGLSEAAAAHLLDRYGRRALDVAGYLKGAPELARPVVPDEPDLRVELVYQRDHEMAVCTADHYLRRTRLGLFHPELLLSSGGPGTIRPAAQDSGAGLS